MEAPAECRALARGARVARLCGGIAAAALISLSGLAVSAGAAPPVTSGAYVGECCGGAYYDGYSLVAELRVGPGGRRLIGGRRGSYIGCDQDGTLLALRPQHGVRIQRDGTFSFRGRRRASTLATGTTGVFRLKVRGRLASADTARIVYSVRPRHAGFGCPVGPRPLALDRRVGEPPFIGCASQPGTTILSNSEARVFEQRSVFGWALIPFAYGCLYSVDKRVPLGLDGFNAGGGGQSLDNFRLAGPYVAFGCGGNPIYGCWVGVDVVDLRDGSVHRPNLDTSLGGAFGSGAGPTDVELKDNGSVAWIAGRDGDPREVGALDANGQRALDRGTRIQPDSLTLDGSTLSWRNGPDVRSTTLD
jgi:hypothetical protein